MSTPQTTPYRAFRLDVSLDPVTASTKLAEAWLAPASRSRSPVEEVEPGVYRYSESAPQYVFQCEVEPTGEASCLVRIELEQLTASQRTGLLTTGPLTAGGRTLESLKVWEGAVGSMITALLAGDPTLTISRYEDKV